MRFTLPFLCAILIQPAIAADGPAIGVAANLTKPMDRIVEQFESETGIDVRVSYGSSGNIVRQIQQHAPFHLFISASPEYVNRLVADGLTEGESLTLAFGRIGAFVPVESPLANVADLHALMNELKNGQFRRIAMANPAAAPYGVAAQQALEHAGVWAMEKDRIVLGENVAQAVQFTLAGGVDAGFIPLSFALEPDIAARGRFFLIPAEWHAPLEQRATLLRGAGPEARRFLEYLRQNAARAILEKSGYTPPERP